MTVVAEVEAMRLMIVPVNDTELPGLSISNFETDIANR